MKYASIGVVLKKFYKKTSVSCKFEDVEQLRFATIALFFKGMDTIRLGNDRLAFLFGFANSISV